MLKGSHDQAMKHVEAGVHILCQREEQSTAESGLPENIDKELSGFFSRMNLEWSLFGRRLIPYRVEFEELTGERLRLINISQARESLTKLLTLTFALIGRKCMGLQQRNLSQAKMQDSMGDREILKQRYRTWKVVFQELKKRQAKAKKDTISHS